MNALYRAIGVSKQSFHQRLGREIGCLEEEAYLLVLIKEIREDHPSMSSRQMYRLISPVHLGRDKFEAFCFANGFKISVKRAYQRTTNSLGVTRFENLLVGFESTGVDQVWVSDITYYRIGDTFYYLTFILDLYSRYIVGHSTSENLLTNQTTIPALEMALKDRKNHHELIIHSDGGGQYYCKDWLRLTKANQLKNSMCESVYENAHAERINGTIKNDYLIHYGPQNYNQLITMTTKAVMKYNFERPHQSLGNISPNEFEKSVRLNGNVIHNGSKRKKVTKKEKTQECG
jgi:putative transposase